MNDDPVKVMEMDNHKNALAVPRWGGRMKHTALVTLLAACPVPTDPSPFYPVEPTQASGDGHGDGDGDGDGGQL